MRKLIAVAALAATAVLPFAAHSADKVRIGYWTSGVSLGYGSVLESKDFLAKRGIEAEFVHFPDVNAPIRALAAGSIDLAFGAPLAGVFSTSAEGVPIRIFAATQPADVQFVVPADSPITSLAELKGKKIGMSPAGSSVAVIAGAVLAGNHGIKTNDFSLVGGNESRLAQFLAQKQVDGAALRSVTIAQLEDELKVKRLGSFAEEWKTLTHSDAVPYIGVGTVSAKLVDDKPEVVARVIAGLRDTLAWGKANPDEVVRILQKSANLPEKDARVYVGQWDAMNRITFEPADIETLRRQHQVFVDGGLIKGELKDDLFATEPYTQAKQIK
ncbi:nitrate ABC transporter substrate-binding protein [Pseudomonas daroniae]|uniref:Nitrate ABC transporter substrate-binding protein n=1 Tax=Phytopseudomonas daroniae TaxID=2487519 RepID=A0A4V2KAN1_9GAMM|nr:MULTISPECIES: ABC transporter substrate-binding protein [Pseudomonas]TBU78016.1 nitrate ABC transporter substrate-binding protein [Pseudomonas daroniae]TBU82364.1 nitrate ABC transporter substrate-binding protein [Pseudomonas sp. FRB 228]TBU91009.1 nitrate ABC transporter substrate-binding protein [Pseudomonas daroniae]